MVVANEMLTILSLMTGTLQISADFASFVLFHVLFPQLNCYIRKISSIMQIFAFSI